MKVTVVIPTYNEGRTISCLVRQIREYAPDSEIIVVDDSSPDGTGRIADRLKEVLGGMTVIHRARRGGLGSAVARGIKAAGGEIIGFMDADLSHPPGLLPNLVRPILEDRADLTFGSRRVKGGAIRRWTWNRRLLHLAGTWAAGGLTAAKDPMSGYFFFRKGVIEGLDFRSGGYKIGLEILVRGRYERALEVPYVFCNRLHGRSKLNVGNYILSCRDIFFLYGAWRRRKEKRGAPLAY